MTVVQQLYDLLAIDVEIERFRKSIVSIDDTLADNHLLLETQRSLEETQATLRTQETERKDLELTVESYHDKGEQLESKLYGGTVRNPRELNDMQVELNLLREQEKQEEESLLVALGAAEETEQSLGSLKSALQEIQTARKKEQKQLLEEKAHLEQDSAVLGEKRQGISSLVDTVHLKLYDSLRSARQGQAVAKIERGMCQGCRISLPTKVVQVARTAQKLVQCPSCSRILYAS
jgi:predicted  nucleic acid-binding Zn-ribbon protein